MFSVSTMKKKKIYPTSIFFHNFCHFFAILATFWQKKTLTLVAYSHSNYGWVLKITSLPPVIIIKIIPTIHFLDIYRVCVLPRQSKFVMVAVRLIIKPLCFSMMNKILSFFCHFGYCFGHFWQNTHIKLPCTI